MCTVRPSYLVVISTPGDELDAVFGTCRDGGRQAGEGIVIGERDDGQSAGLDCHLRYVGGFAGAVGRG